MSAEKKRIEELEKEIKSQKKKITDVYLKAANLKSQLDTERRRSIEETEKIFDRFKKATD